MVRNGWPSYRQYIEIFGSWNKTLLEAGYDNGVQKDFFSLENLTPEKWYIIGYIIGDGNVFGNSLRIASVDLNHLENIKDKLYLDTKTSLKYYEKYSTCGMIGKKCKSWINDLKVLGIIPRKSYTSYLPLEYCKTERNVSSLCLGIFDSDGTISFDKRKRVRGIVTRPIVSVYGTYELCNNFKDIVFEYTNINGKIYLNKKDTYSTTYSGKDTIQLFDFLYKDKELFLERKHDKWKNLIKIYKEDFNV